MTNRIAAALALILVGSCIPAPEPLPPAPPPPAPEPAPTPAPTPPPALPEATSGWMEQPQSPGDWFYVTRPPFTMAAFGASATDFGFVMRCDRASRTVSLGRVSDAQEPRAMRVVTETSMRQFTGQPRQGAIETLVAVDLDANDRLLDAMAISKGRFAVEVAGEPSLYIPSWPEVTRVIEDCR
ncbi:MAG TPA: hypothetical protein VLA37_09540 [Sphingomonadaceae bacterium]|nr:hypothetical protein [Sphingomonadaceae bacterium]